MDVLGNQLEQVRFQIGGAGGEWPLGDVKISRLNDAKIEYCGMEIDVDHTATHFLVQEAMCWVTKNQYLQEVEQPCLGRGYTVLFN